MAENSALLSLYKKNDVDPAEPTLAELLQSFTTIRATQSDGLPGHICLSCISDINRAISFKQQSERSEHSLRSYFEQQNAEPPEESTNEPSAAVAAAAITTEPPPQCPICGQSSFSSVDKLSEHISAEHNAHLEAADDEISIYDVNEDDDGESTESGTGYLIETFQEEHLSEYIASQLPAAPTNSDETDAIEVAPSPIEVEATEPSPLPPPPLPPQFNCCKCGAGFAKEKSLNIHQKSNKCMEKSYECLRCKRVFIRKENLVRHMAVHHLLAASATDCCSQSFGSESELQQHRAEHVALKHKCQFCGKGLPRENNLCSAVNFS